MNFDYEFLIFLGRVIDIVGRVMGGTPSSVKKHPWSVIFYEYTQRQCHPFHEPDCKPWEPSSISKGQ